MNSSAIFVEKHPCLVAAPEDVARPNRHQHPLDLGVDEIEHPRCLALLMERKEASRETLGVGRLHARVGGDEERLNAIESPQRAGPPPPAAALMLRKD